MLKKMRQEVETMSIKLIGTLTEEHPKHYTSHSSGVSVYRQGPGSGYATLKQLICHRIAIAGVSETLRKGVKISYDVEVI